MRKILLLTFLAFGCKYFAQSEGSAFTLTGRGVSTPFALDYQSLGINPANLGLGIDLGEKRFAIGISEIGVTTSSRLFNNEVIKNISKTKLDFDVSKTHSFQEFASLSSDLQDGFDFNADYRWLGMALTVNGLGTFAFSLNDKYQMDFALSKDFADIATYGFGAPYFDSLLINNGSVFKIANTPAAYDSLQADTSTQIIAGTSSNPKSIAEIIEGTTMNVSWVREWTVGFGRQIFTTEGGIGLSVGASVKYIQGLATFDLGVNNGQIESFASYSPSFNNDNSGTGSYLGSGSYRVGFPQASGSGMGLDFGTVLSFNKFLRIGAAFNNIGTVSWTKNTYKALTDQLVNDFKVGGFYYDSSVNLTGSGAATFDSVTNALLKIEQTNETKSIPLASTFRLGLGIFAFNILELGVDIITPFNKNAPGSLAKPIVALGTGVKLGKIISLSTGLVFGGNYPTRMPFSFMFSFGSGFYEIGFSTRDVLSLIRFNSVEKPIISASGGVIRFKF